MRAMRSGRLSMRWQWCEAQRKLHSLRIGRIVPMHKAWPEITEFYKQLASDHPSLMPMANLIKEIRNIHGIERLYAWTSVSNLCMAQTLPTCPFRGSYFEIVPTQDKVEIRYVDPMRPGSESCRQKKYSEAACCLRRALTDVGWFPRQI